jgi:hypothetical protein
VLEGRLVREDDPADPEPSGDRSSEVDLEAAGRDYSLVRQHRADLEAGAREVEPHGEDTRRDRLRRLGTRRCSDERQRERDRSHHPHERPKTTTGVPIGVKS